MRFSVGPFRVLGVVLSVLLLAPATAGEAPAAPDAPPWAAPLDAAVDAAVAPAVAVRHHLHANPELSNREEQTAALVAERLRELGYEVETGVAHTGVVGLLRGGRPGPVVAVRADMDALPVTEASGLPFASTERTTFLGQEVGVAHACGHDVHVAVGLGVAAVLAERRAELPGTVKFLFQPAEEGPPPGERGGASLMIEEGVLDDPRPEAIFALHTYPELEVGKIGWVTGPTYAAVDQFVARIEGRQAHGAAPHTAVDPIVMGAQAVMALQTIRSRNLPPDAPSVVTVGIFRGGERFNIIPQSVHLEGTVRTYDPQVRADIERRMGEILDGVTRAGGGRYELDYVSNAPATINDAELARRARAPLERAVGADDVVEVPPVMGGEDFAYFSELIPGFYFRLGTTNPEHGSGGLHTPSFRADDGAVEVGIRAMAHVVWDFLATGGVAGGEVANAGPGPAAVAAEPSAMATGGAAGR
ncbi:MAG TPA: amidohydrolase [Thermoanaerobaculia bacterium]|nr:amidohydrolase [Thermoanaerobaculia bacterium]